MQSLARGLAVIRCFGDHERTLTISDASRQTGFSRAAVRRCLHTLVRLGYAIPVGQGYCLCPKVLSLGYAYVSSSPLAQRAQPMLEGLRDELGESCSLGVLEDGEVLYVARAEARRIMSISLRVGSRLPLHATSMGRVLLAGMPEVERRRFLRGIDLQALTEHTASGLPFLLGQIKRVEDEGFAIVDQELELGLRSLAVPVTEGGRVIAAVNIGTQAARVSVADLRTRCLPALRSLARQLTSGR